MQMRFVDSLWYTELRQADITIDVADDKTLTYSGAPINVGAYTLTMSGGGSLVSAGPKSP